MHIQKSLEPSIDDAPMYVEKKCKNKDCSEENPCQSCQSKSVLEIDKKEIQTIIT